MPEVGIRQLRNHLSAYLRAVQDGNEVTVTDHGRAVARIIPVGQPGLIDRLIADGVVTPAASQTRTIPGERARSKAQVSDLVIDQRR